ncbi:MAG TPA: hypothetical protein VFQ23_03775 [Anaerolineales bacterium]|nr:hypothetical protein [Anaerolineales bacterium]
MIPKASGILVVFLILLALLPAQTALADTGPKPRMDFQFRQEMTGEPPVTIMSGILYECDQADCSDAAPIEEVGPQGFRCEVNSCSAIAYGFAPYHRIAIEFSDGKTRQSNIFETAGFESKYTVIIRPDDLIVETRFTLGGFPRTAIILTACFCAVVGVGLVLGLIIFLLRRSTKN